MRIALSILAASLATSLFVVPDIARAVDGVFEINETCAETTGCFDGDAPGWPVTIESSGSYRLTSNLYTGNAAVTAIEVVQSRVTIDLNGFEVSCGPLPFFCIVFGKRGQRHRRRAGRPASPYATEESHDCSSPAWSRARGRRSRTSRSSTTGGQSLPGISVGENSIVRSCIASDNAGDGILTGPASLAEGNTAMRNGIRGIDLSQLRHRQGQRGGREIRATESPGAVGSSMINNTVHDNDAGGILGQGGSMAIGNTIHDNAGPGMSLNGLAGYGNNVLTANNGNAFASQTNPEVVGGQQIGTNLCGTDTVCP